MNFLYSFCFGMDHQCLQAIALLVKWFVKLLGLHNYYRTLCSIDFLTTAITLLTCIVLLTINIVSRFQWEVEPTLGYQIQPCSRELWILVLIAKFFVLGALLIIPFYVFTLPVYILGSKFLVLYVLARDLLRPPSEVVFGTFPLECSVHRRL